MRTHFTPARLHARAELMLLRFHGAHPLHFEEAPRIHAIVECLSLSARISKPRIYEVRGARPNAFSLESHSRRAALVLTTGARHGLEEGALVALLAREIAHIARGHTRRATVVAVMSVVCIGAARAAGRMAVRLVRLSRRGALLHRAAAFEARVVRRLAERLHLWGTPPSRHRIAEHVAARLTEAPETGIWLRARRRGSRFFRGPRGACPPRFRHLLPPADTPTGT